MQLVHLTAPPPLPSPQQRYATLHRSAERGLAADKTWAELVEVCLDLGRPAEARTSFDRIADPAERRRVAGILRRVGVAVSDSSVLRVATPTVAKAPLREAFADLARFLTDDQMPAMVIAATAVFPIVVGVGAFAAQAGPGHWLPWVSVVPAGVVLALIAVLARRVLQDAAHGIDDAPRLPRLGHLPRALLTAVCQPILCSAVLLGPAVLAHLLHAPIAGVAIATVGGALLLPMAIVLSACTSVRHALQPRVLLGAAFHGGESYAALCSVLALLFAPALGAWSLADASFAFLRPALVGPLVALPALVAARMLGRFARDRRVGLGLDATSAAEATTPATPREPARTPATERHDAAVLPLLQQRPSTRHIEPPRPQSNPVRATPVPHSSPAFDAQVAGATPVTAPASVGKALAALRASARESRVAARR